MSNPIKKLLGQTAVYGLSSIVGRLLNYLLVPLYTQVFADPSDYGVGDGIFPGSPGSRGQRQSFSQWLSHGHWSQCTIFLFVTLFQPGHCQCHALSWSQ